MKGGKGTEWKEETEYRRERDQQGKNKVVIRQRHSLDVQGGGSGNYGWRVEVLRWRATEPSKWEEMDKTRAENVYTSTRRRAKRNGMLTARNLSQR